MSTINLSKLDSKEIQARAKVLYFDKMPNLDVIFADEFGRFSYEKGFLLEQNDSKTAVYQIDRKGLKVADSVEVRDLSTDSPEDGKPLGKMSFDELVTYISENELEVVTVADDKNRVKKDIVQDIQAAEAAKK